MFKALGSHQDDLIYNAALKYFFATIKDDSIEEVMNCNEILDHIQNQDDQDHIECNANQVVPHEGLSPHTHPSCNGSLYNVTTEWDNEEVTSEPLSVIEDDDTVACALHTKH